VSEILENFSNPELFAAIEDNDTERCAMIARHIPRASWRDDGRTNLFLTGIPSPVFNRVFGAQLDQDQLDAQIEAIIVPFKALGAPMYWCTGPATKPAELGVHLQAHGLRHEYDFPGMAADLRTVHAQTGARPGEASPPDGLTITPVASAEALRTWCDVMATGFGAPPLVADTYLNAFLSMGLGEDLPCRWYLGLLDGEPVATSSLVLCAGVAGIYHVATLPQARGRGIGEVMSLAALAAAREMGYRIAILRSSEMGVNIYRRLGFRECCKLGRYVWTGEAAAYSEPTRRRAPSGA
jgi:GNAT superfamily N-acetyltransferase